MGQKDAKGKLFHNEVIKTAETKGSGWVDYMFPKPGQTEASQKWAYVKKVTIDGVPGLVASGFYPNKAKAASVGDFLNFKSSVRCAVWPGASLSAMQRNVWS